MNPLAQAIRATIYRPLDPNDPMYYVKGFLLSDPYVLAKLRERLEARFNAKP